MPLTKEEGPPDDEVLIHLATRQLRSGLLSERHLVRHAGLAVSGGGDSMAMLWLVAPWARANGIAVSVATVDHGLRPGAAEEARFVADVCEGLGVPHAILRWEGWSGRGNLQAAAREARRELLARWAGERGADAVLLAHTRDDQAETVLMRLARGSGVDGLAAMREDWRERGRRWMRPLLDAGRADLRAYLRRHGRAWIDDPSNEDDRFGRSRARRALAELAPLGLTVDRLVRTACHMGLARSALEHLAQEAAQRVVRVQAGDVVIAMGPQEGIPVETQLRLLAEAIRWVSGEPYRLRHAALLRAFDPPAGHEGGSASGRRTLGGTVVRHRGRGRDRCIVIGREPRAVTGLVSPTTTLWDGRWRLSGTHAPDLEVRMLGEDGIALCPGWRGTGIERSSVLASPAVWRGATLVAAPVAGRPEGWTAEAVPGFHEVLRGGR